MMMSNELLGEIVIIKRNGGDGARFPLKAQQCTFGRDPECDIRIQIPQVELEHAKLYYENGKIWLQNLAQDLPTLLNSKSIIVQEVSHKDIFTISERSFRFEFPERRKSSTPRRRSSSKKTPLRSIQGSPRTPAAAESLKKSITKLRRDSAAVQEEDEAFVSPKTSPKQLSVIVTPVQQKENTPEEEALCSNTPSILKKKKSASRSEKKRISFGPTLSPELFDKHLPPSTPLRKGKSPSRRLSEPLQRVTPGSIKAKKRCSLGTTLGKMPIMEEEEDASDENNVAPLCDTPPQNLPTPLLPINSCINDDTNKSTDAEESPLDDSDSAQDQESITPVQGRTQELIVRGHRLLTPLQHQIKQGINFRATKKKMKTPLRQEIESRPKLKKTLKKLGTPLRKEIESQPALKKTKKSMPTPLRKAIQTKPSLKATKKKLATPLRKEIQGRPKLRATKKMLATPVRNEIKKGVSLRTTKRKMKTPLRKEIQNGVNLRVTKPTLPTPLRSAIKAKPVLRETKKRLRKSLQNDIIQGKELRSKFAAMKKLPGPLKTEIEGGIKLNQTLKSIPTPLKNAIKGGVELRKTKKTMRKSLQAEIVAGTKLRKTKLSAPTPLRNAIKAGKKLRKTKPVAPTPLRKAIKKGVKLRETKKKLCDGLLVEIKKGKELKKTKVSAPTPFREEIKKGVKLRQTKKKLDAVLQKEIRDGKELKKTKKSAPTPFRNEIKKGVKLRATKKRLSVTLHNEIKSGLKLVPVLKKSLKTPVRDQIRSGVKLRKTLKKIATPVKAAIESRRKSLRSANREVTKEAKVIEESATENADDERPLLKAKRRLGPKTAPLPVVALEIPTRLSEKIDKPAKKRVCRRSTPKKIAELRDQMQFHEDDGDMAGSSVSSTDHQDIMSPVLELHHCLTRASVSPKPAGAIADAYLSETSCEDMSSLVDIPNVNEILSKNAASDDNACSVLPVTTESHLPAEEHFSVTPKAEKQSEMVEEHLGLRRLLTTPKEKNTEDRQVEEKLGLKRLLKTPKAEKQGGIVEEKLGLRRLMKTPKEKSDANDSVDGELGLKRLMRSPKESAAPLISPHLDNLFREERTKEPEVSEKFGLKRLMQTPKDRSKDAVRYSIEPGALSTMFKSTKVVQVPVENMNLQDFFTEVEFQDAEDDVQTTSVLEETKPDDIVSPVREEKATVRSRRRGRPVVKQPEQVIPRRGTRRGRSAKTEHSEENNVEAVSSVELEQSSENSNASAKPTVEKASVEKDSAAELKSGERRRKGRPTSASKKEAEGIKDVSNEDYSSIEVNALPAKRLTRARRGRAASTTKEEMVPEESNAIGEITLSEQKLENEVGKTDVRKVVSRGGSCASLGSVDVEKVNEEGTKDDSATDENALSDRRTSRRQNGRSQVQAAGRRRTRRNPEPQPLSSDDADTPTEEPIQMAEKEEIAITLEVSVEPERSLGKRRGRKSIEQVVQEISGKKAKEILEKTTEANSAVGTENQGTKPVKKSRKSKKIEDNAEDNAGVMKVNTDTPPKMQFSKTSLTSILEETESQIGTPGFLTAAAVEIVDEGLVEMPSTRTRGKCRTASNSKDVAPLKHAEAKPGRTRKSTRQPTSTVESEESLVPEVSETVPEVSEQPDEQVNKINKRQTRGKQAPPKNVQEKTKSKRKRQTAVINSDVETQEETQDAPEPKRARRGTQASKEVEKPVVSRTLRSTRSNAR